VGRGVSYLVYLSPISPGSRIDHSLQFSSFFLTVTSRLPLRRMMFPLPSKMRTFQMAPLLAHLPRSVPSPTENMGRSPPPALSYISMCSPQMRIGLHQMTPALLWGILS
jgi:hypothetical protein